MPQHVIHAHTIGVVDGNPKLPTTDRIEYGEIAVNYAQGYETLSIKNSNNDIVTFSSDTAIKKLINDDAKVIANALNDLNKRINQNKEDILSEIEDDEKALAIALNDLDDRITEGDTKIAKMEKTIEDNELIIANGFLDFDDRITENTENIEKLIKEIEDDELVIVNYLEEINNRFGSVSNMVSITYADLKDLRDNEELVPGQLYRITDFATTTVQEDTRSVGHAFDVIVTATDIDKLNENAKAVQHDGDTYFNNANLEAWELKYCLDNDTARFVWADTTNGKGVIYYMKDEWNNECPYDFKNIQFKRYQVSFDTTAHPSIGGIKVNDYDGLYVGVKLDAGAGYGTQIDTYVITNENTNFVWAYTFSGVGVDWEDIYDEEESDIIMPTFSIVTNETTFVDITNEISHKFARIDSSREIKGACMNNVVEDSHGVLSNNVFFGLYVNEDSIPQEYSEWYELIEEYLPSDNYLGMCSLHNTLLFNSFQNRFDSKAYGNLLCEYTQQNYFGNTSYYNVIGEWCNQNSFGDNSREIHVAKNSFNIICGNGCDLLSFGESSSNITVGNLSGSGEFGEDCGSISVGNHSRGLQFGSYCYNIHIGNNVNTFYTSKDYIRNLTVESNSGGINFTSTQTTSDSAKLQNIIFKQGINPNWNSITISHNTLNDTFITTYQPSNSVTVDVTI